MDAVISTTTSRASRTPGRQLSPARLLGSLLVGFIAGVALQLQQAALFTPWVYACMLVGTVGLMVVIFGWPAVAAARQFALDNLWRRVAIRLLLLFVAGACGFSLTGLRALEFQKTALNPALEGKDIQITGRVEAMPQFGEDGLRFRFKVESARLDEQRVALPPQIYLGWYAGFGARSGKTPVTPIPQIPPPMSVAPAARQLVENDNADPVDSTPEQQRQPQTLRAGERWTMAVRLKAPHGNSNPHGFDYELWLWEQGLQATGYVRAGVRDTAPQKLGDSWAHPIERARQAVREAVFGRVANRQLAGVLAALVVGDQNAIERADWDVYRATGVAHLMSISGLHITMFAWVAALLLGWLWKRSVSVTPSLCLFLPASSAAALGGLLLATLYALFSGWGGPAQRTIWMLATVVLLRQNGKQWPWPYVWLLTMAVVVLLDPWALLQAGFWLSFVAVGVLFAAGPPQGKPAPSGGREPHAVGERGGDSFAPISIARRAIPADVSGQFDAKNPAKWRAWLSKPLAGMASAAREQWVVTLALTPLSLLLFNQVSLVGLLANAVAIPWVTLLVTPLAMMGVFWAPFWDAAAWTISLLTLLLQWLASWSLASITIAAAPLWCAIAGVVGGALLALRLPLHWRALGVPLLLPVLLWQPLRPALGQFDVLGADIGQGNALLVRTAHHSLVYDTGPRFSRESDAGHRVLVPLLRALGERIDVLVLSHRDLDHTGGAPAVLAMQPQASLLSSIEDGHELQSVRPSTRCVAGQRWRWDAVDFEILHPAATDYDSALKSNAMSCVLRISNGVQTALLAGDLESPQEGRLVADTLQAEKLKANFLLVPHHGSKTSSSAGFLDAVQPQVALAQAGYRNRFGHPVASVMARYSERGIRVQRSPSCGAATWRSDLPEEMLCQRQQGLRYWHHRAEDVPGQP